MTLSFEGGEHLVASLPEAQRNFFEGLTPVEQASFKNAVDEGGKDPAKVIEKLLEWQRTQLTGMFSEIYGGDIVLSIQQLASPKA